MIKLQREKTDLKKLKSILDTERRSKSSQRCYFFQINLHTESNSRQNLYNFWNLAKYLKISSGIITKYTEEYL